MDDADWLMAHLARLTDSQESSRPTPWHVTDAPKDFIARQLSAIVGLELTIGSLEGTWKVSQNRDAQDRAGVQRGLLTENTQAATAISDLIKSTQS